MLVSPDVLPDVGPVNILDLPHKWSDHAALFVSITNLEPPAPHEPVAESSKKMKQFNRRKQRSIATMFASRVSSPKVDKAAASEITVSQSGTVPEAALELPGTSEGVGDAIVIRADSALPEAKRRKVAEVGGREAPPEEPGDDKAEDESAKFDARADAPGSEQSLPGDNAKHWTAREQKIVAAKALKSRAEQAKRDAGQQGIKSFFTKTAQQRCKN